VITLVDSSGVCTIGVTVAIQVKYLRKRNPCQNTAQGTCNGAGDDS